MIARRTLLRMGDDDSDSTAPKRKRKRKRKVAQTPEANDEANPATEEEKPAIELKAREDSPVELKVQDVREIMGGSVSASSSSAPVRSSSSSENASATDELSTTLPTSVSSASPPSSRFKNDSMEQLLADARRMREEEAEVEEDGEQSGSIKATIGKGLSAIVTADFFVVMAFLVWFLVGIFSSSILKNDTIQIAFNSKSNFERRNRLWKACTNKCLTRFFRIR